MNAVANKQPRGWVVAVRLVDPLEGTRTHWRPAFEGAVFASREMAERKAVGMRDEQQIRGRQIRVLREGIVK